MRKFRWKIWLYRVEFRRIQVDMAGFGIGYNETDIGEREVGETMEM